VEATRQKFAAFPAAFFSNVDWLTMALLIQAASAAHAEQSCHHLAAVPQMGKHLPSLQKYQAEQ
jgi:hypothetical protein